MPKNIAQLSLIKKKSRAYKGLYYGLLGVGFLVAVACTDTHKSANARSFPNNTDSLKTVIKTAPVGLINYCDSILLNKGNSSKLDVALAHFYRAGGYNILNDYDQTLADYAVAVEAFKALKQEEYGLKALTGLANVNIRKKNYTLALEQAHQALELAKKIDDKLLVSNAYSTLAFLSYVNNDYGKALDLTEASIINLKETANKEALAAAYNNQAILYKNIGHYDDALQRNHKSLAISEAMGDTDGIATTYTNIGSLYSMQQDYKQAIVHYKKSLATYAGTAIKNSIPYTGLADVYTFLKQHDSAQVYLKGAVQIEKDKNNVQALKPIYDKLLQNAFALKDYSASENYKTALDGVNLKIDNQRQQERINMLESQSTLLQNKFDLQIAKSNARTNRIVMFSMGLLILFVILFFIQLFKTTKLNHQKNKNQLELKVLRSQMNPHFIFNALSAIQNTVMEGEPIKSASYLSRFAKLIRQNFEFTSKDLVPLADDLEALKNYIETQLIRFKGKFSYTIDADQELDTQNTLIPPMLLQPFVENAIEHGFKGINRKGLLQIAVTPYEETQLLITITDNGKGYQPKIDDKPHATKIIKRRLKLLNQGDEENFSIQDLGAEVGTKVSFTISY